MSPVNYNKTMKNTKLITESALIKLNNLSQGRRIGILVLLLAVWSVGFFFLGSLYQLKLQDSKSNLFVPNENQFQITSGTVINVGKNEFKVKDLRGTLKKFNITEDTIFMRGEKEVELRDIKPGESVRVIPDQTNSSDARHVLIIVR